MTSRQPGFIGVVPITLLWCQQWFQKPAGQSPKVETNHFSTSIYLMSNAGKHVSLVQIPPTCI